MGLKEKRFGFKYIRWSEVFLIHGMFQGIITTLFFFVYLLEDPLPDDFWKVFTILSAGIAWIVWAASIMADGQAHKEMENYRAQTEILERRFGGKK